MKFDYKKKADIFTAVPEAMLPCECCTLWVVMCFIGDKKPARNDFQSQALSHMRKAIFLFYLYILLLRSNGIKGHSS